MDGLIITIHFGSLLRTDATPRGIKLPLRLFIDDNIFCYRACYTEHSAAISTTATYHPPFCDYSHGAMSAAAPTSTRPSPRTVLVTGANGYIGCAVSKAFVRAGWKVFGLVRRPEATLELELGEVIPIVGQLDDLSWVEPKLYHHAKTFDVIVNCLESFPDYETLFNQVMGLIVKLAKTSNEHGVRPLLLWSSGCKDYGLTPLHGDPDLAAHTEATPLNPPAEPIRQRAETSLRVYDHKDLFGAVILRPTSVYGYTSSYYGTMMDYAAQQAANGEPALRIPVNPNVPMHAAHVDDCAEAYVALAEHKDRPAVAGQAFNISAFRYETVQEIGTALAKAYNFADGVKFLKAEEAGEWFPQSLLFAFNFPQWVDSEKIRSLTGWTDKRMLFSDNVAAHRLAYEAEEAKGHDNIRLIRERMKTLGGMPVKRE